MRMNRVELGGTHQIIIIAAALSPTLLKQDWCNTMGRRQNTMARDKDASKAQINQRELREKEEEEEKKKAKKIEWQCILSDSSPEQAGTTQGLWQSLEERPLVQQPSEEAMPLEPSDLLATTVPEGQHIWWEISFTQISQQTRKNNLSRQHLCHKLHKGSQERQFHPICLTAKNA
jgi:hypothetical protein